MGLEPTSRAGKACTPNRQSGCIRKVTDEVVNQRLFGALPLSYGATVISSGAGGTRTHNRRLQGHVLQLGSRSSCFQCPTKLLAETRRGWGDVVPAGSWAMCCDHPTKSWLGHQVTGDVV